ncbi:hypothetical protein PoB_005252000 [Plakobranchus ocellatus]|uniref:Uncharacterized protein n=1 Tax=Plakobranchus ocellatus TaxID=259542 RepID=A0AAV4C310_9GAST|nr:hypothetical protein PoB_005252000 [Plakobranchus ocellatus]
MLNTSELTMSLTLAESEDGSLVLTKTKEGGKKLKEQPDVENSGQDYFSSLEDQILSSEDQEQTQGLKRLLQTEATIHSESGAAAFPAIGEYENSSSGDQSRDKYLSVSDSQPAERFSESEKVAINTADGDEVSTLPYSHSRGHGPRSQGEATPNPSSTDSNVSHNERDAFAKNGSVGVGYGAVNLHQ